VAADYEAHAGNVADYGSAEYQAWVDALASVLPEPPTDVLDVASGTGYLALAGAGLGHRVTAVDLAPAMVDELVVNAATRGLAVDARLGDAVAPGFSPASFDAVTSRHLLWTLREPAVAMANWRELLRPGGRLVAEPAGPPAESRPGVVQVGDAEAQGPGRLEEVPVAGRHDEVRVIDQLRRSEVDGVVPAGGRRSRRGRLLGERVHR
jgi:SAM-dependent methyltransferase